MKSYKTIEKATEARTEVRRSLFIASLSPAATAEEADAFVASVRAKYPDATHNCYAYIAGAENPSVRFSDDGEPGGTAGQPMLEVLKKRGLTAVAVVVTRYFGGIKLGAGGLVSAYTDSVVSGSAYTDSVVSGIDAAGTVTMTERSLVEVRAGYQEFSRADSVLIRLGAERMSADYGEDVRAVYAVKADAEARALACASEATSGAARTAVTGRIFLPERAN